MIDIFIWDEEEILDTFIYNEEENETSLHEYELINPLKNLKSTLVLVTKKLSLVISWITELCCDVYLNVEVLMFI